MSRGKLFDQYDLGQTMNLIGQAALSSIPSLVSFKNLQYVSTEFNKQTIKIISTSI